MTTNHTYRFLCKRCSVAHKLRSGAGYTWRFDALWMIAVGATRYGLVEASACPIAGSLNSLWAILKLLTIVGGPLEALPWKRSILGFLIFLGPLKLLRQHKKGFYQFIGEKSYPKIMKDHFDKQGTTKAGKFHVQYKAQLSHTMILENHVINAPDSVQLFSDCVGWVFWERSL